MTLPNDSVIVTPGSGTDIATHLADSKEHPVVMLADSTGHLYGSLPTYLYSTPNIVTSTVSRNFFDIWNGSAAQLLEIRGIWIIPKTDATLAPTVAVRVDAYRTSAIGATATATASYKSATPDVAGGNICPLETTNAALDAGITARWLPTTGATISEWLFPTYASTASTFTSMAYLSQYANILPELTVGQRLHIRPSQGLLLKQGPIASTGNVGFLVAFSVEPV